MANLRSQSHEELLSRAREFRSNPTPAEATLWRLLRRKQLGGFKFRRQHVLGPFIVDFYCPKTRLVVELDGRSHLANKEYDLERSKYLEDRGLKITRFSNDEVLKNTRQVLEKILRVCLDRVGS